MNALLQLQSIGQCSKIPTRNLYAESNLNTTFPYPNRSSSAITHVVAVNFGSMSSIVFAVALALAGMVLV
jgi:hypothetical protein